MYQTEEQQALQTNNKLSEDNDKQLFRQKNNKLTQEKREHL